LKPAYVLNVRNYTPETYSGRYNSFSCRTHVNTHTQLRTWWGQYHPLHCMCFWANVTKFTMVITFSRLLKESMQSSS